MDNTRLFLSIILDGDESAIDMYIKDDMYIELLTSGLEEILEEYEAARHGVLWTAFGVGIITTVSVCVVFWFAFVR